MHVTDNGYPIFREEDGVMTETILFLCGLKEINSLLPLPDQKKLLREKMWIEKLRTVKNLVAAKKRQVMISKLVMNILPIQLCPVHLEALAVGKYGKMKTFSVMRVVMIPIGEQFHIIFSTNIN